MAYDPFSDRRAAPAQLDPFAERRGVAQPTPKQKFHSALDETYGQGLGVGGPIGKAAMGLIADPMLDLFGPQSALTNKLFGGEENFGTHAADVGIKLAPLAAGLLTGGAASAGMEAMGVGGSLLADTAIGGLSGAAGGAASAEVNQTPVAPAAVAGALGGAVLGLGVNRLSSAGAKLAAAYAKRNTEFPLIAELDQTIPHVSVDQIEVSARTDAARQAFRARVPAGSAKESIDPIIWKRALSDAKQAAMKDNTATSDLEMEGDFINRLAQKVMGRSSRVQNPDFMNNTLDVIKQKWGQYVTRLEVTLSRDKAAFGTVGPKLADMIHRAEELKDPLEGRLVQNVWKTMWHGVPKEEEEIVDSVLHGEGGQLSTEGLAAVKRWRDLRDLTYKEMSDLGLQEEVRMGPAASTRVPSPFSDFSSTGAQPEFPAPAAPEWKTVPLQYRTNYVPYYRDPAGMARLAQRGTKEHEAYIQKLISDGEADNRAHAEQLLYDALDTEKHGSPLQIRSGPMQHERELALEFPRVRNAKQWSRQYFHDYARRTSQAKVFGPQDEEFIKLRDQLKAEGGDVDRLDRLFRIYVGRPPVDVTRMAAPARAARTLNTMTLLGPRVGILQLLQLSNTAGRIGVRHTLEALVAQWRNPELRAAAEEVGALLPSEFLLTDQEPVNKLGEWWINNVTQMPHGDRAARSVSALAGGVAAKKWAQEYWKLAQADAASGTPSLARGGAGAALKYVGIRNPAERMAILQRRLEETLGIPIAHVMKMEGELPIESLMSAMRSASHNTQFANTLLTMPEARRTGWGQFLYMLKTFSKQQTPFITKMTSDAARGDTGPLVRYLLVYPALYTAVRPYLDFLAGKDAVSESDADAMEKVVEVLQGSMYTGIFGSMGDFVNQMAASDPGKLMGYAAGPAISNAAGTIADVTKAVQGDAAPITKRALRSFPPFGPLLSRWIDNQ